MPYPESPGCVPGSETSCAAAESIDASSIRSRCLEWLKRAGTGTCDELEVALGLRHQTASARLRELVLMGRVFDTQHRRPTRSGRKAAVYALRTGNVDLFGVPISDQ